MNINYELIDTTAPAPEKEPERQRYFIAKCREIIKEKEMELGRKLTFYDQTFGCQMNFKDSEKLNGILEDIGYVKADTEKADFVYYNTCTVRENANVRVYGRLGALKNYKKKNPEMVIAMCGCMMQEPEEQEKVKTTFKFVDVVFGTHNILSLQNFYMNVFPEGRGYLMFGRKQIRLSKICQVTVSLDLRLELILCLAVIISAATVSFLM